MTTYTHTTARAPQKPAQRRLRVRSVLIAYAIGVAVAAFLMFGAYLVAEHPTYALALIAGLVFGRIAGEAMIFIYKTTRL